MIGTVNDDQGQILFDIITLHNNLLPFEVDLSWGNGGFWKNPRAPILPKIRMDLLPTGNLIADVEFLPFKSRSLHSVVFDPPFIHAPGKDSIMGKRFSGYPSQKALMAMYRRAGSEIYDALAPGGLLVWKCQDIVESGKQVWNHCKIIDWCGYLGFELIDLFILTASNRPVGHNHGRQVHARKHHSYFLCFRKK